MDSEAILSPDRGVANERDGRVRVLADYERACAEFSWERARLLVDGLPGGAGLNIAHEAVDRHAAGPRADRVAIRHLDREGHRRELSYRDLARLSSRFANALDRLGITAGDRVFVLMERTPRLFIAAMGILKARAVFCPLFAAFGPEPIQARVAIGEPRMVITTRRLLRRRLAGILAECPSIEHVVVVPDDGPWELPASLPGCRSRLHDWNLLLDSVEENFTILPTDPSDPAMVHFTSGTTGTPKGAIHAHESVVSHLVTSRLALDLQPEDIFWCTADPGWVTATSYGIIAPLAGGVTSIVDERGFDAAGWYRILQEEQVTVWYTSPTAIRMLMKLGSDFAREFDTSRLQVAASVGEPLNPEAVEWGREALGIPILDNWWQTETGGIMIANFPTMEVRPGSMGRPLPGVEAAVVDRREDGAVVVIERPDIQGELALRPGWPGMFRGYLGDQERYEDCFRDGWYLSGDLVRRDSEGYFWFVGRKDDLIKTSGHLVGPFEVESVLLEHDAVAEAAVIGKPDPDAYEVVKAFVTLSDGFQPCESLAEDLLGLARKRLGSAVAPREIEFVAGLPRTRSGKLLRRLLKARELGLPEGDLSMLEPLPATAMAGRKA